MIIGNSETQGKMQTCLPGHFWPYLYEFWVAAQMYADEFPESMETAM